MLEQVKQKLARAAGNPTAVMSLVMLMYVAKAVFKIAVGTHIHSPMIAGDGYHNLADLLEAAAVIVVILVSMRPSTQQYPFGRKNVEFFTSLAIGLGLLVMSFQFAFKSLIGLLHLAPQLDAAVRAILPLPVHEQLVMDSATFPWALAVTACSVLLSFVVGRYQVAVGRASGHASMVADGEETLSDGTIECVTVAGVLGEYLLHLPWLEYPLGLVVAFLIARTGRELFVGAWRVLLQHSIGAEHESRIRELTGQVPGVLDVSELKTFQVGHIAVCMMSVTSRAGALAVPHVKYGIEHAVESYILQQEFKECELHIRFTRPDPQYRRLAYAAVKSGQQIVIAPSLDRCTHLLICDEEEGEVVRIKAERCPADPVAFLVEKRVAQLFVFCDCGPEGPKDSRLAARGINLAAAVSYLPSVLGLSVERER